MDNQLKCEILHIKSMRPRYHKGVLTLILVLKGSITIHKVERVLTVGEGEITFVNKSVLYYIESSDAYVLFTYVQLNEFTHIYDRIAWVEFVNINELQEYDRPLKERLTNCVIDYLISNYQYQFEDASEDDIEFNNNQLVSMLFNQFQIISNINEEMTHFYDDVLDRYYDIVYYINNHITEKIMIEDVLKEVYMNPTYFSQFMKNVSGVRFKDFVKYRKLILISTYIIDESYTMSDIALKCGMNDMKSFYTIFKKYYQTSPGKYRKKILSIEDDYQEADYLDILEEFKIKHNIYKHKPNTVDLLSKYILSCMKNKISLKDSEIRLDIYKEAEDLNYYQPYKNLSSLMPLVRSNNIKLIMVYDIDIMKISEQRELLYNVVRLFCPSKKTKEPRWSIMIEIRDMEDMKLAQDIKQHINDYSTYCDVTITIRGFY